MADRATAQGLLDGLRQTLDAATDAAARIAALKTTQGWDTNIQVYACGHLDAGLLVEGCRGGAIPWWAPLAAMTYFGRLDDLRTIHAAMEQDTGLSKDKTDLSSTMTWGCWLYAIVDGMPPAFNEAVLNQLFDWGAKPLFPCSGGGTYFDKALRSSPAGIVRAFLTHGASCLEAQRVRDELLTAQNYKQATEIQKALDFGGFYTKVDDRTVMETKYISEPGASSILRTVFNFGARRVNEVFETKGAGSAMTSCNFEDYDSIAVDAARAALEKLGGMAGDACTLDKKKKPALSPRR